MKGFTRLQTISIPSGESTALTSFYGDFSKTATSPKLNYNSSYDMFHKKIYGEEKRLAEPIIEQEEKEKTAEEFMSKTFSGLKIHSQAANFNLLLNKMPEKE